MVCRLYNTERCLQLQLFNRPTFWVHFSTCPLSLCASSARASNGYRKRSDSPHLVRRTMTCPLCLGDMEIDRITSLS